MNLDYKKVCRTCLESNENLKYIFDPFASDTIFADMIMTCTTVIVSEKKVLFVFYNIIHFRYPHKISYH